MSRKVSYSNFFTPPKFLEMSAVAVEILETGIYFLTSRKTKDGLLPDQHGFIPLANGVVSQGEVVNQEAVIKALVSIRHKTGMSFARFSIPEEKTYIFKTHLPNLEESEIYGVLDFKLEENIPLSSKEAVFDFDIVKSKEGSTGLDVVVSAVPLKVVKSFEDVFKAAGLTPIFASPESSNVAKSLVSPENEQVSVIVNIRETKTVLSLVVAGLVYQTSSIGLGSASFNELIAKSDTKKNKLYLDNKDSHEVFSQIVNTVSIIKDDIEKFISYSNHREDIKNKVNRVILCGHDSTIVGLSQYISAGLGLPVEVGNVWANNFLLADHIPTLSRAASLDYAAVNGLNLF